MCPEEISIPRLRYVLGCSIRVLELRIFKTSCAIQPSQNRLLLFIVYNVFLFLVLNNISRLIVYMKHDELLIDFQNEDMIRDATQSKPFCESQQVNE